jgi:hypothetical protein
MYEEPSEEPIESAADPQTRAKEKADEFRMFAELAAVFEGPRKFDAALRPDLTPALARDLQQSIGRLEKARSIESPQKPPACSTCPQPPTCPRLITTCTAAPAR